MPLVLWSRHVPGVTFGWEAVCANKEWRALSAGGRTCAGSALARDVE